MSGSNGTAINHTPAQRAALESEGNLLIAAGAGAGKTRTLVDRAIREITRPVDPASLDELLIVTFTDAAASELRDRIRIRLDELCEEDPDPEHLHQQSALVEQARISTLHQFCLEVIRDRFDELELDPEFSIMSETDTYQLQEEILDQLFIERYEGDDSLSEEALKWIQLHGRGIESNLRDVVIQINTYARTLPSPEHWLNEQRQYLSQEDPLQWKQWWHESVRSFLIEWKKSMETLPVVEMPEPTGQLYQVLQQATVELDFSVSTLADVLKTLAKFYENLPRGHKQHVKPWQDRMKTAGMFRSLMGEALDFVPLKEDWELTRHGKLAALELAAIYMERFRKARLEAGWVDFQDLEQYALKALMCKDETPSEAALEWRERLSRVFVDEYQDINAAQDAILRMVSRDGDRGNRFLVGDVKQSIYRFRLADPRIFQTYYHEWLGNSVNGQRIALQDNFRSHEAILAFVNRAFEALFHPELGGVAYDSEARLLFGARESRSEMSIAADTTGRPRVQLALVNKDEVAKQNESDGESDDANEAVWVARKLRELRVSGLRVGVGTKNERAVDWGDMVVLVRSPKRNAEVFQQAFNQEGIPLIANTGGFLESRETQDMLALLKILDNPLQDTPALATLRSPFGQITAAELAEIRTRSDQERYWDAFVEFVRSDAADIGEGWGDLHKRCQLLHERFQRWRQALRKGTLAGALEQAVQDVDYESWFLGMDDAPERIANVRRMISLAADFDRRYRKGLYRFLKYIEILETTETDLMPPAPPAEGAVRLMSVHQSKGLEFPVVVVADLARRFNMTDLRQTVILDEDYGLCSRVQRPGSLARYPSLPYMLARDRQKREALGEELRLLYVALTRASERLLLFGSMTDKALEKIVEAEPAPPDLMSVEKSSNWLQWILQVTPLNTQNNSAANDISDFEWGILGDKGSGDAWVDSDNEMEPAVSMEFAETSESSMESDAGEDWARRMEWEYPFQESIRLPGKTSVSRIKSTLVALAEEGDAESEEEPDMESMEPLNEYQSPEPMSAQKEFVFEINSDSPSSDKPSEAVIIEPTKVPETISAAERGNALHSFMEKIDLSQNWTRQKLIQFAQELVERGVLTSGQLESLEWKGIEWFLKSDLGRTIAEQFEESQVYREVPFTWWTDLNGLERLGWEREAALQAGNDVMDSTTEQRSPLMLRDPIDDQAKDHVVIQGVMDLVVVMEDECWLVDYKTDRFPVRQLTEKAKEHAPQMRTYREALEALYGKPVKRAELVFIHARRSVLIE